MTNLTLSCLFCLLAAASVSAGSISVYNTGGFVAKIEAEYTEPSTKLAKKLDSGSFTLGQTKAIEIPDGASNVKFSVTYFVFPGVSSDIFDKSYPQFEGGNECYKIWGVSLNPSYAKIDC